MYCSVPARKFINRGFLYGPYCPIYGVGACIIITVTAPITRNPVLVFLVALLAATSLEYFTGWLMESVFQIKWWDYSKRKFNLKGRICLKNSLLFGCMGLIGAYVLHPIASDIMRFIPRDKLHIIASAIIFIFLLDLVITLNNLLKLTEKLKSVHQYILELEQYNETYAWFKSNDLAGSIARLKELCQKNESDEKLVVILNRLENIAQRQGVKRLTNAFPNLKAINLGSSVQHLHNIWNQQVAQYQEFKQFDFEEKVKYIGKKTTASTKSIASSFTENLNFYRLVWIFVTAGTIGYIAETLFCLAKNGVIESRQGLLYGPFSQVYAFGAVIMVLLLAPLAKKNDRWVFFGSMALGGIFEYFCSYIQENVFGSVSWEYSGNAFSIGGRTCLTYMFYWGILGLAFIKGIYPWLCKLVDHIPKRQGLFFAWIFVITLSINMFLSATAVSRWSQRLQGIPPANAYEQFLDNTYPNDRLEEIYPNMKMI